MSIDAFLLSPEEANETIRSILVCPLTQATMLGVEPLDCAVSAVVVAAAAAVIAVFIVKTKAVIAVVAAPVIAVVCY